MVLKGGEEGKDGGRGEEEHGEVLIWKRAMAARPRDPQLWCGYSTLLVRLGRTAEAVEGFQRALKIDPNHMATICNFAIFMEQQGNTEVVCELYERALAADTSPVTAMSNYGHFLCRRGDFDRAEEVLKRALKAAPRDVSVLHNYGCLLWEGRREFRRAEELLERALRIDPSHLATNAALQDLRADIARASSHADAQAAALLAELENGLSPKPASGKSRSRRKKKNGVQEAPAVGVPPVDGEAHVDAGAGEGGGDAARADTGEASEGDCRAVDDGHRGVGGVEGLSDVASSIAQAVGEAAAAAPAETREALSQNGEAERASGQEAAGGEQAGGQESVDEVAAAVPAGQRGDGGHPPARPSWEFPPSQAGSFSSSAGASEPGLSEARALSADVERWVESGGVDWDRAPKLPVRRWASMQEDSATFGRGRPIVPHSPSGSSLASPAASEESGSFRRRDWGRNWIRFSFDVPKVSPLQDPSLWMLPQVIPSVHILDQPRPAQGGGGGEDRDEAREDREAGAGERGVERAANIQLEDRGSLAGSDPQRVHAGGSGGESRQGAAGGHPAEPDKADGGGHGEAGGVRNAGGGGWGALLEGLPLASAGSGSVRREGDGEGGGGGGHAEEVGPPAGASGAGGAANEDEGDASARRGRAQDETLPPDEAARRGSGGVGSAGSGRKKRTSVVGGGAGKLVVEAVEEDYDFDDVEGRDECIICFEGEKTHLVVPCGHLALCVTCASLVGTSLAKCPICNILAVSPYAIKVYRT
ncbi:hypothetical protein T484DRAFT_1942430 [Baffinella frigidus]|nr:hypothetical protein T484DRAFT_1942430 [Cryptophyta sp. CCMP2293]